MQQNVNIICPHCKAGQKKQITVTGLDTEFRIGQVFTCAHCGKDYATYYKTNLVVKAQCVATGEETPEITQD